MALHLLIVDDDQEISGLMRLKLKREAPHFTIATVEGGRECVEYVRGNEVDCVLSDYQMPGMNGMELLKRLRGMGDDVPFIFLTGQGNEEVAREAFKNGAFDYFTKEIGFAHFARIINSIEQAVRQRSAERARAAFEFALLESENRHKVIIGAFPDMIFMLGREGVFLDMNVRDDTELYAPKDKVIGGSLGELMPPEVARPALFHLDRLFKTGEMQAFSYKLRMQHGIREYEARLAPIGKDEALCIVRDVTGRNVAESALKESEARFRCLVEDSLAGVYIIQDDKFIYVNPRLAEIFGYTQYELIGKKGPADTTLPEDRDLLRENIRKRLSGEVKSINYQLRGVKKTGEVINVEVYGSHTVYGGRPAVIGTLLDITERRRSEEERTALFHMLTHDIKGPLTLIFGYAQMLSGEQDKEAAEMAAEIKNAARRISSLIDDMLTLSCVESPGFRPNLGAVALDEVLGQAVKENRMPASEKDVTIGLDVDGGLPSILADRVQLARAFGNLVGNAVKFNRRGGEVHVRAFTNGPPHGHVIVEVSDTGVGIHDEDLPHVFEKYYRGRKTAGVRGTGLGLAVVKAVAQAHGGTVSVASKAGEGSTFRVALPVKA